MFGELVSSSLPWLLEVRRSFRYQGGAISHSTSKIPLGMSQQNAVTSFAVMLQAHSSMTTRGTKYLRPCSVRRPYRCLFLAHSRALGQL